MKNGGDAAVHILLANDLITERQKSSNAPGNTRQKNEQIRA